MLIILFGFFYFIDKLGKINFLYHSAVFLDLFTCLTAWLLNLLDWNLDLFAIFVNVIQLLFYRLQLLRLSLFIFFESNVLRVSIQLLFSFTYLIWYVLNLSILLAGLLKKYEFIHLLEPAYCLVEIVCIFYPCL